MADQNREIMVQNRREILIDRMEKLFHEGKHCGGCPGTCCTFEANSMLLTPLEAWEILTHLQQEQLWTEELVNRLQKTVSQYRLEPKAYAQRAYLRKHYT